VGRVLVVEDDDRADFVGRPFAVAEFLARVHARHRVPAPGAATRWLSVGPVRLAARQAGQSHPY
jgi:two-component system OmpR family response regulator